ncbi:hypothetical protein ACJ5NV_20390 [Loktanella agnita]|uniref:hypothetical protein n=1 Tax=Loktanella agnita TaxID=287097 RepID=UPI0039894BD0
MNSEQANDEMARVLGAFIAAEEAAVVAVPPKEEEPRMPWPEEWFVRRDRFDLVACQRMWGAVLLSCLRGALGVSSAYETEIAGRWLPTGPAHRTSCWSVTMPGSILWGFWLALLIPHAGPR